MLPFSGLVAPFLLRFKYTFHCTANFVTAKPLLASVFFSPCSEKTCWEGVTRGRFIQQRCMRLTASALTRSATGLTAGNWAPISMVMGSCDTYVAVCDVCGGQTWRQDTNTLFCSNWKMLWILNITETAQNVHSYWLHQLVNFSTLSNVHLVTLCSLLGALKQSKPIFKLVS